MRRKAAAAPVVINNQKVRTASEITQERRLMSSVFFPVDGHAVGTTKGDLLLTETAVNQQQPVANKKNTGRPKNASEFTSYVGSLTVQSNAEIFPSAGKTTIAPCLGSFDNPCVPKNPVPASSGSDFIRQKLAKQQACGEQHIASELGPSVFKDNTISRPEFNKQYLAMAANLKAGGTMPYCEPNNLFPAVEHVHSLTVPRQAWSARPTKSGIPKYDLPSQDYLPSGSPQLPNCFNGNNTVGVFSRGGILPKDALRYVEKHHGNDLSMMVNGRKPVPGKYRIPAGAPAHLKINDTLFPSVNNSFIYINLVKGGTTVQVDATSFRLLKDESAATNLIASANSIYSGQNYISLNTTLTTLVTTTNASQLNFGLAGTTNSYFSMNTSTKALTVYVAGVLVTTTDITVVAGDTFTINTTPSTITFIRNGVTVYRGALAVDSYSYFTNIPALTTSNKITNAVSASITNAYFGSTSTC